VDDLRIPCLVGATASGKSAVALRLARRTGGEIVAADAFTAYRGMALLTAAPDVPPDVPHHLVGTLDPSEAWSAAAFADACDAAVAGARARGRRPWVVGGTALYVRTWLKGLGAPVPRDAPLRRRLEEEARRDGHEALHRRLAAVDPERARDLHPHDVRRVVRALEIVAATGRKASAQRTEWAGPDRRPVALVGLRRSWPDLEARILRRTETMFEAGVVEEARALLARPLSPEARKALGLATLTDLLAGHVGEAEARQTIARATRRFARKQMTFFRSFVGVRWIDVPPEEDPESTAERVLAALPAPQG
jgi:tRNA dimethylallyltransferase